MRLIDADALEKRLGEMLVFTERLPNILRELKLILAEMPTIDAKEDAYIDVDEDGDESCAACGREVDGDYTYCTRCGRRLVER